MTALLWCFPHEMRAALDFRKRRPGTVRIRSVIRLDIKASYEEADEIYASTYCYGRILKMYEGTDHDVEEVWLAPDYRHRVEKVTKDGSNVYVLQERTKTEAGWRTIGDPKPTTEDAWAILDEKELGL